MELKDQQKRKMRALRAVIVVALFLALPVGSLIYLQFHYGELEQPGFKDLSHAKPIESLLWKDAQENFISATWFEKKVTVVMFVPPHTPLTAEDYKNLTEIEQWTTSRLTAAGNQAIYLVSLGLQVQNSQLDERWQKIEFATPEEWIQEYAGLLSGPTPQNPVLLVIDGRAIPRLAIPLGPQAFDTLKRHLSVLTFNLYLYDYLSKRTFFGERRA